MPINNNYSTLKGLSERELKSNSSQIHSHFHFHFHFAKTPSGMAKGGSERLGTAREVGSMRWLGVVDMVGGPRGRYGGYGAQ